jgi:hypothetical protein
VGTSSVAAALEVTLEGRSVAHVYWPRAEHLRAEEVHYKSRARGYCGKRQMSGFMPRYVWLGQQLGHAVKSAPPDTVWDVLTLVRSPVARNVSSATVGAVRFLRSRIPHDTKERKQFDISLENPDDVRREKCIDRLLFAENRRAISNPDHSC